ncbi:MAG: hypothetical protein BLITH_0046 [Brockia lithotrophica]|uniref:Uncharacterized protein n=1 Tax=Brockia lithotrophica TaxID=933949 RepID=A0A2T5G4V2_9BACL|nr:MAG: hypothetical protein BLITH_0046 [Brockia lithotrophica]
MPRCRTRRFRFFAWGRSSRLVPFSVSVPSDGQRRCTPRR